MSISGEACSELKDASGVGTVTLIFYGGGYCTAVFTKLLIPLEREREAEVVLPAGRREPRAARCAGDRTGDKG